MIQKFKWATCFSVEVSELVIIVSTPASQSMSHAHAAQRLRELCNKITPPIAIADNSSTFSSKRLIEDFDNIGEGGEHIDALEFTGPASTIRVEGLVL
jgi:hypothetical protein